MVNDNTSGGWTQAKSRSSNTRKPRGKSQDQMQLSDWLGAQGFERFGHGNERIVDLGELYPGQCELSTWRPTRELDTDIPQGMGGLYIVNEILSNCVTGTIFDPQTNSCILDDTIANEILSKCDTGTIFDPETNSCILEDLMARFLKSRE